MRPSQQETIMDALGALAFAVGVTLNPLVWVMAAVCAWAALPRWSLVLALGLLPGPTVLMLGAQMATVRSAAPSAGQWLAVALVSVLATALIAGIIRWHQRRGL
jgi:hypothetical protein